MNKLTCKTCGVAYPPVEFRERKPGKRDTSKCRHCRREYLRGYRGAGIGNGPPGLVRPVVYNKG